MGWVHPEYSKSDVDEAGRILAAQGSTEDQLEVALQRINNWRACHNFPLNTFQSTLRRKAEGFSHSVVVQRVKRLSAIEHKLRKHTKKPILLSEMQDIGGCRVVLANWAQVNKLYKAYLKSDLKHTLIDQDNYIKSPKPSGYRGNHLIYSYKSDRKNTFDGLKVEIQMRSQLQHAWATAVEIVGFFRQESLKSSEGDIIWRHFFKLAAAEIAFEENAPFGIPNIPGDRDKVRDQLRRVVKKLGALTYLQSLGQGLTSVQETETGGSHYFLLQLNVAQRSLKVTGYKLNAQAKASWDYAQVERAIFDGKEHADAVLVSAGSMADLKRAYSNYFLDMHRFTRVIEEAIGYKNGSSETTVPR
jgi:ppGpp synthetase/RelA/SpoT-type nucleotidyltranferase